MKMMVQQNVLIFMQVLQDDFYGIRAIESHVDGMVVEFDFSGGGDGGGNSDHRADLQTSCTE